MTEKSKIKQKIKYFEEKAKVYKKQADKEWAKAKNDEGGEHYVYARKKYEQLKIATEKLEKLKSELNRIQTQEKLEKVNKELESLGLYLE